MCRHSAGSKESYAYSRHKNQHRPPHTNRLLHRIDRDLIDHHQRDGFPPEKHLASAVDEFITHLRHKNSPEIIPILARAVLCPKLPAPADMVDEFVTDSGAIDVAKIEEVMLRIVLRLNVEAPDFGQSCLLFCRLCSFLVNGYAQIDILAIGTMGITREMGAVLGPQADLSPVGLMRIAMRALLLEVRQEHLTGSCAMVSVLSAIQNDHPKVFLAMLREMFRYGCVTLFASHLVPPSTMQVAISTRGSLSADAEPHVFLQRALIATIADGQMHLGYKQDKRIANLFMHVSVLNQYIAVIGEIRPVVRYDATKQIKNERFGSLVRYGAYDVSFSQGQEAESWELISSIIDGAIPTLTTTDTAAVAIQSAMKEVCVLLEQLDGTVSGGHTISVAQSILGKPPSRMKIREDFAHANSALKFFLSVMAHSKFAGEKKILISGDMHGYTLCPMLSTVVMAAIEAIRRTNNIESGIAEIVKWAQNNPERPIPLIDPGWEHYLSVGVLWQGRRLEICAQKCDGTLVFPFGNDFAEWTEDPRRDEAPYLGSFLKQLAAYKLEDSRP